MAIIPKNKRDFSLKVRDDSLRAENTASANGGMVVVGDHWVRYGDVRIDIPQAVAARMATSSRRIFNNRGDVMYVLICLDESGTVEVVPSIAMNRRSFGVVKTFPDLSGKLPLMLVKLRHDGSGNLNGMLPVTAGDIEVYRGYGNFTLRGKRGATGPRGFTGFLGVTGGAGLTGYMGLTGPRGYTGIEGRTVQGATGPKGADGQPVPAYQTSQASYVQDVVDSSVNTWNDTVDDSEDNVQDTV